MAFTPIDLGNSVNDGTGDTLRQGGSLINGMLLELYGLLAAPPSVIPVAQTRPAGLGDGDVWIRVNF